MRPIRKLKIATSVAVATLLVLGCDNQGPAPTPPPTANPAAPNPEAAKPGAKKKGRPSLGPTLEKEG